MKVHKNLDALPAFEKAVITIGTFDGVHRGHQQIIAQLQKAAREMGGETVVVTFDPHPRKIVGKNKPLYLINTLHEKIELLAAKGIDHLVIVPFTQEFASQSAQHYVENFLVEKFHPDTIIIGYDHRFGKNREGNYTLLEQYAARHAFKLVEIPEHVIDEITISSTRIREALLNGQTDVANHLLGYNYFFEGLVVDGNKLGRALGYPTANLHVQDIDKLIPGNGIYAVETTVAGQIFKGMMSIGIRPTINGKDRVIEVNIFDFNKDIYGQIIRVYLKKYLRKEEKFPDLDALKDQLAKDKIESEKVLGL